MARSRPIVVKTTVVLKLNSLGRPRHQRSFEDSTPLCAVGFFVLARRRDDFGFFSLRTRRSPRSSCVGRPVLVADLNNPSVGVSISLGGAVVPGHLTRRATLRNGSRDIRHWPGLDAGVGGAGLAIEPQCDSSI